MDPKNLEKTIKLRHKLHMYPELATKEEKTLRELKNFIKENTKLKIKEEEKWFYAYKENKNNKKSIAFVEDFDALLIDETIKLPYGSKHQGISHKCGHDGHAATLAGLALEIDKTDYDKNIYLIFQHAEEIGKGAKEIIKIIKKIKIDEIYKMHNANYQRQNDIKEGEIIYIYGINNFASQGLTIKFFGKNSHASLPEDGINPVFAINKIIDYVENNSNMDQEDIVFSSIVEVKLGDKNFGKNPGYGEISMTIRAKRQEKIEEFIKNLLETTKKAAQKYKIKTEIEYSDYFPEVKNHKENVEKIKKAAENLGYPHRQITSQRSSEDFGYYTQEKRGAYFLIGNGKNYPQAHTVEFDYNDKIIEIGVEMFKELIRM